MTKKAFSLNLSQNYVRHKFKQMRGEHGIAYREKASVCGKTADGVIEVGEGRVYAVTFLFDLIEFFESSVLESKILKACEKSLNISFVSNHPCTAFADSCEWGQAAFFYDAKQGDLSLEITFQRSANDPSLRPDV